MKAAISIPCWSLLACTLLLWASSCSGPNTADPAGTNTASTPPVKTIDARFVDFTVPKGICPDNDSMIAELSDGVPRPFAVVSAYAQPGITITSLQGDVVSTRTGSGYTLYVADYPLDPASLGTNPGPDQVKLEFTFITQDKSTVKPGIYGKQKDNLAVGPNLFYGGKAYPMKNNFVGGVNITVVDDQHFCGEIRLKSKYEVVILGNFQATIVPLPERP